MFFKPNFCCKCGQKIERAEWRITTSRRFCEVCEVEFKGEDLLSRGAFVLAIILGIFSLGVYLSGGSRGPELVSLKDSAQPPPQRKMPVSPKTDDGIKAEGKPTIAEPKPESSEAELSAAAARSTSVKNRPTLRDGVQDEPVYFCGAMTKKGRPCSRRVKVKGRCWQHIGQPSALASQSQPDVY